MNIAYLNIGLRDQSGAEIIPSVVLRAMRNLGIRWGDFNVFEQPGDENVMAIETSATDDRIHKLAELLDQDCIAVWSPYHNEGRMIGPRPEKWLPFNGAFFTCPNGRKLEQDQ